MGEDVTYVSIVTCAHQVLLKSWRTAEVYALLRTLQVEWQGGPQDSETTCPEQSERRSAYIHRKPPLSGIKKPHKPQNNIMYTFDRLPAYDLPSKQWACTLATHSRHQEEPRKAAGPDSAPHCMVREWAGHLLDVLTDIFQLVAFLRVIRITLKEGHQPKYVAGVLIPDDCFPSPCS